MRPVRSTAIVACVGWLALTTGYAAAAAADPQVDLGGTPVPGGTGSTDKAHPTVLDPGLWADSLGDAGSAYNIHYFSYHRRIENSTVHIGVVGASSDDYDGFSITATGTQSTDCASTSVSPADSSVPYAVFGAAVSVGSDAPDDTESVCLTSPEIDVAVERTTSGSSTDDELPIAIKVVEEAPVPVAAATDLPEPPESPTFHRLDVHGGDAVQGSTAFDDAPAVPLADGRADFSTTVTEGEERLFRIPLEWGQSVSVEATAPKLEKQVYEEQRGYTPAYVALQVLGPLRDSVTNTVSDVEPSGSYGDEPLDVSDALPPVGYLNRFDGLPANVPGDYWLAIGVSPPLEDADALEVPLDVAVVVTSENDQVPAHSGGVLAQGGGKFAGDYDPARPFLVGDDEFSAVASGAPLPADDTDGGWWSTRRYAGLALVVAGAASAGAGLWRLRRR